mmetsp:Transcript_24358/g.32626  ORF Transcript_24358/g.32626 Transcript_24358/m.32626 type:complete len:117 (-) Transcript_24358:1467-1817(-)
MKRFPRSASKLSINNAEAKKQRNASEVRLKKQMNLSPSSRQVAGQFSFCKNNQEFKLNDIVKQFEELKTLSAPRSKVKGSVRDLLEVQSRQSLNLKPSGGTKQSRADVSKLKLHTI